VARTPLGRTSVADALDSAIIALTAAGCATPRLDAEVLLADVLGVDRAVLVTDPRRGLEPDEARRFMDAAARRRAREPVAYILGRKGFRYLELEIDARVLIPRPETEGVVEAALDLPAGARVVDVGTGSGAIALALKSERPDLEVLGTEVSAEALVVAHANAERLGLDVALLEGDLLEPVTEPVDAVLANVPYVADDSRLAPEIGTYEPDVALYGGEDGLDVYRRLAPAAAASGARFVAFEVGGGQSDELGEIVRAAGFGDVEAQRDLAGIERVVVGRR
jgi:release factor glutamine methyltransferase